MVAGKSWLLGEGTVEQSIDGASGMGSEGGSRDAK